MLKIMLIQRGGETTHRIVHTDTDFDDFHNLVTYDNLGKSNVASESNNSVYVPHNETTYTLVEIDDAEEVFL